MSIKTVNDYTPTHTTRKYDETNVIDALYMLLGGPSGLGEAVSIADGADIALGTKSDTPWDSVTAAATLISIQKKSVLDLDIISTETTLAVGKLNNIDNTTGAMADAAWNLIAAATLVSIEKKGVLILNDIYTIALPSINTSINTTNTKLDTLHSDLAAVNAAVGTQADTKWSGTGNASEISVLKKIVGGETSASGSANTGQHVVLDTQGQRHGIVLIQANLTAGVSPSMTLECSVDNINWTQMYISQAGLLSAQADGINAPSQAITGIGISIWQAVASGLYYRTSTSGAATAGSAKICII